MSNINPNGTVMEALMAVAEGVPGALSAIMSLNNETDVVYAISTLDKLGIYGGSIWVLYKNCCDHQVAKMMTVLFAVDQGIWAKEKLDAAIANRSSIDLKKELTVNQLLRLAELARQEERQHV